MRVLAGKVVGGKIVVEGEHLEEGSSVTVLDRAGESTFQLDAEQERELLEAIAEVDRGEVISAEELFRDLRIRR